MPIADPTWDPNIVAGTRRAAKLELCFIPTATPLVWDRVPSASELGAPTPNNNNAELPLFYDASGKAVTLRAITENGGSMQFSTAAPASNAVVIKMYSKVNYSTDAQRGNLLWRYTAADGRVDQGQGLLTYRGEMGSVNDIPQLGWTIEISRGDYNVQPTS